MADVAGVLGPVAGCSGPRGEFAYSHGGYAVLGQLIADLTGTSFAQAATRLVLEPLGMADSWFPARAPVSPDAARSYRLTREGSFEPEPLPVFALQAAGGLWSTGPDLVRFGSGWRTLLPADLAGQALRPHAQQYDSAAEIGLGWLLRRQMDAAGHNGGGPGSSASLITRPGTGRTSVVLISPVADHGGLGCRRRDHCRPLRDLQPYVIRRFRLKLKVTMTLMVSALLSRRLA